MTSEAKHPSAEQFPRSYPAMAAAEHRIEPCPRRIRGIVDGETVLDTSRALYVWEWPGYPQYYIPAADVRGSFLESRGRPADGPGLTGTVHFDWDALDAWFEEDEQVFVHPRNPYTRVDALRSSRHLQVEIDGVVLAESRSPVLLFETGLPTRYYVAKTDLRWEHLRSTDSQTSCPYKGTTTTYWSAEVGGHEHEDVAWCYDFPVTAVASIAGLVAFYNEKVDLVLDGRRLEPESAPPRSRRSR